MFIHLYFLSKNSLYMTAYFKLTLFESFHFPERQHKIVIIIGLLLEAHANADLTKGLSYWHDFLDLHACFYLFIFCLFFCSVTESVYKIYRTVGHSIFELCRIVKAYDCQETIAFGNDTN